MTAHYEVVRTDGVQPWHARLVSNGRILATTETYARQVGAERAIVSTARAHDVPVSSLRWNVEGVEKVMVDVDGRVLQAPLVKYLDERSPRSAT